MQVKLDLRPLVVITGSLLIENMELQITREEVEKDGFLEDEEIDAFFDWLENRVLKMYPTHNTHDRLLKYLELFKSIMFQST